jgi:small subunit ribosomal protein S16
MALKIRLRQQGRTNRQFYRLVVTDVRAPRDGKYVESIGWYNPVEQEEDKILSLDAGRLQYWISQGAQLTETVEALVAKSAPAVLRQQTQRIVEKRAKALAKRRAARKTTAAKKAPAKKAS